MSFDALLHLDDLALGVGPSTVVTLPLKLSDSTVRGERIEPHAKSVDADLTVTRTSSGWSFKLEFEAAFVGACSRCLEDLRIDLQIRQKEVHSQMGGEELVSPYVKGNVLDVGAWSRDSIILTWPDHPLCKKECKGLCFVCGVNLNEPGMESHRHEAAADPRWSKLRELG